MCGKEGNKCAGAEMKDDNRSHINRDECEEHLLQVELHGIKVKGKPSPATEPIPRTWGEVSDHVKQSMMRLAVEPLALVADVLSGARSIVRGVAALPAALGARLAMSQQKAVDLEEDHQRQVENRKVPLQLPLGKAVDCKRVLILTHEAARATPTVIGPQAETRVCRHDLPRDESQRPA